MKKVKVNEELTLEVPTKWKEMTYETYCRIYEGVDKESDYSDQVRRMVCNVLGIEMVDLLSMPMAAINSINSALSFMNEPISPAEDCKFVINTIAYDIADPEKMTYRQYIDVEQSINPENAYDTSEMLATILLPMSGKYDKDKVKDLQKQLLAMPADYCVSRLQYFVKKKENLLKAIRLFLEQTKSEGKTEAQPTDSSNQDTRC